MAGDDPLDLPFDEAIQHFRAKVNIPTDRWNDLWQGMHARGFMVAGAKEAGLLADLRAAVDAAIADGETLEQFRTRFDQIVDTHGWNYRGGRDWRTRVIYETNLGQTYEAGRHAQMTDPAVLKYRPWWQYVHGHPVEPRLEHLAWDGLVLRYDDPWWKTHAPKNGWGCTCTKQALSDRQLRRLGKDGPDKAPPEELVDWTDKRTGKTIKVPKGVDPGFGYSPGEAAFGRDAQRRALEGEGDWEPIDSPFNPGGPAGAGRPLQIPVDRTETRPISGRIDPTRENLEQLLRQSIGGDDVILEDPAGGHVVIGQGLIDHVLEEPAARSGREAYWPFIPELIRDPFEIWVGWARNTVSGRVELRRRYVKAIELGKDRFVGLVAEVNGNAWAGLTFLRGELRGATGLRRGLPVWWRPES